MLAFYRDDCNFDFFFSTIDLRYDSSLEEWAPILYLKYIPDESPSLNL